MMTSDPMLRLMPMTINDMRVRAGFPPLAEGGEEYPWPDARWARAAALFATPPATTLLSVEHHLREPAGRVDFIRALGQMLRPLAPEAADYLESYDEERGG